MTTDDRPSADIARRKSAVAAGRIDGERWTDPSAYEAHGLEQARAAGGLCEEFAWVCDIGCGPLQSLRHVLPADVVYLPADVRIWAYSRAGTPGGKAMGD